MLPNSNQSLFQLHQAADVGVSPSQQIEHIEGKFAGLLRDQLQQSTSKASQQSANPVDSLSGDLNSGPINPIHPKNNSSANHGSAVHANEGNEAATHFESHPLANSNRASVNNDAKEVFEDFVGQTFFSTMLASLRSTQGEAAYMNGGRAEEIFRGQLDQYLSEYLSDASAEQIAAPMYERFSQQL